MGSKNVVVKYSLGVAPISGQKSSKNDPSRQKESDLDDFKIITKNNSNFINFNNFNCEFTLFT